MFPTYIFYGMSYDLYWNGDPTLVKAYKEAHDLAIEAQNQKLWLQGFYNYSAIATAISNIHLDGKHHKINEYMEKPIDIFAKAENDPKKEAEKAKQKVIDKLNSFKKMWDAKG